MKISITVKGENGVKQNSENKLEMSCEPEHEYSSKWPELGIVVSDLRLWFMNEFPKEAEVIF